MADATPSSTEPQAIAPSNAGIEGAPQVVQAGELSAEPPTSSQTGDESATSTAGAPVDAPTPAAPLNTLSASEATLELQPMASDAELKPEAEAAEDTGEHAENADGVDPARAVLAKIVGILRRDFNIFSGELKAALEEADQVL
jgi:hypothetical protein